MLRYILATIGILASFTVMRYRERVADMMGEAEWMNKVGGVYNVVVIIGVFIFFWSVAALTGTDMIFFSWIPKLIPGLQPTGAPTGETF
jgi:uncharacterized membrane protein YiaA